MWFQPFLHIIYAYMGTFTLFICLIQIRKRYVPYTKIQRYEFLLILPSPTLKKRAFGNILARCVSVASREKPFIQTEFMPFIKFW